jgi:hypothetical protein
MNLLGCPASKGCRHHRPRHRQAPKLSASPANRLALPGIVVGRGHNGEGRRGGEAEPLLVRLGGHICQRRRNWGVTLQICTCCGSGHRQDASGLASCLGSGQPMRRGLPCEPTPLCRRPRCTVCPVTSGALSVGKGVPMSPCRLNVDGSHPKLL